MFLGAFLRIGFMVKNGRGKEKSAKIKDVP